VTAAKGSPRRVRSHLHTKEQLLCSRYAGNFSAVTRGGCGRGGSSGRKAPTEAPLIFQEFSGFGLYRARQEGGRGERGSSQGESLPPAIPLPIRQLCQNREMNRSCSEPLALANEKGELPGGDCSETRPLAGARLRAHQHAARAHRKKFLSAAQFPEIYSSCKPLGANFSNQPYDSIALAA